jgi:hypothetical protein
VFLRFFADLINGGSVIGGLLAKSGNMVNARNLLKVQNGAAQLIKLAKTLHQFAATLKGTPGGTF